MKVSFNPDKKLFVKHLLTTLTVSLFVIVVALVLQFFLSSSESEKASKILTLVWPITAGIVLFLHIVVLPLLKLWINNLAYVIETDRIIIKKGILSKIEQNIPFSAITDFMFHRSPYDRILNIGSIRIQTAGQSVNATGYEGSLDGLINYNELYNVLREKLNTKNTSAIDGKNNLVNFSTPDLLTKILMELTAIRELMENNKK